MLDFEKEEIDESRLKAYQKKIAERKNQRALSGDENEENFSSSNEGSSSNLPVSNAMLQIQVDDKIDAICTIDKEYQNIVSVSRQAEDRAKSALQAAADAAKKQTGFLFGKNTRAIEALQDAQKEQSYANEANAKAITEMTRLQERIIEATKALFALGVSSVAANRSVYRQLELKLKGASERELSDLARNELLSVMKELNERQDMMAQHKKLSDVVHDQKNQLEKQQTRIEEMQASMDRQKEESEKEIKRLYALIESNGKKKTDFSANSSGIEEPQNRPENLESTEADKTESDKSTEQMEEKRRWWQKKR